MVVVKVPDGGAGVTCNDDLVVKKVTPDSVSEQAGVSIGMELVGFVAGREQLWLRSRHGLMTWKEMKAIVGPAPRPWTFTFQPSPSTTLASASKSTQQPQQQQPSQQPRHPVQSVDGHEWVDSGSPDGFAVQFCYSKYSDGAGGVPAAVRQVLEATTVDSEDLIKAEDMREIVTLVSNNQSIGMAECSPIVFWLADRLSSPSINSKLKTLFVLKKLLIEGGPAFQVCCRANNICGAYRIVFWTLTSVVAAGRRAWRLQDT